MRLFLGLCVLHACALSFIHAQTEDVLIISEIEVQGNTKTKARIIFRELDFAVGDTILAENLAATLEENRNQVYNLGLFNEVEISSKPMETAQQLHFIITVKERWFTLFFPVFELADRNFNVWWNEYNHDFRRTKYGFYLLQKNVRGLNETFGLNVRLGYNRKINFIYDFPFIDSKKIYGLRINFGYYLDKELRVNTLQNKEVFFTLPEYTNQRLFFQTEITRRKEVHLLQQLRLSINKNSVVPEVLAENPHYFSEEETQQLYPSLRYKLSYDQRDIQVFPTQGFLFRTTINYEGLGLSKDLNLLNTDLHFSYYKALSKRFFAAVNVKLAKQWAREIPYFNVRRLGFLSDYLRGYEYYVIEAEQFAMLRTALRYKFLDVKYNFPWVKKAQFQDIPLQLFFKTSVETARMKNRFYSEQNPFDNATLLGYGVGLEVFSFYDSVFGFEYNWNHLGEPHFALQINLTWDY